MLRESAMQESLFVSVYNLVDQYMHSNSNFDFDVKVNTQDTSSVEDALTKFSSAFSSKGRVIVEVTVSGASSKIDLTLSFTSENSIGNAICFVEDSGNPRNSGKRTINMQNPIQDIANTFNSVLAPVKTF